MAKRRRNVRRQSERSSPRKTTRKSKKNKSLKERLLTVGIWGATIINITLIVSLLSNFFTSTHDTPVDGGGPTAVITEPITVEVLNGCGVPGLANEITEFLRNQEISIDVVNVGNYQGGFNLERTFVLDRVALNHVYANKVGEVLGVAGEQITPQVNDSLQLMVTVIVGKDYKQLKSFKTSQN